MTKIKILNEEEKFHLNHPINKCFRLINTFSIEAFLKQNQSYFFPANMSKAIAKMNRTNGPSSNFNATATQLSPTVISHIDLAVV